VKPTFQEGSTEIDRASGIFHFFLFLIIFAISGPRAITQVYAKNLKFGMEVASHNKNQ